MASQSKSVTSDGAAPDAVQALTGFINTQTLLDLAHRFSQTYTDLARTSTEHFLVTPVTALPTGKEKGKFLAIDVGGTNLRVGWIELLGHVDAPSSRKSPEGHDDETFAKIKRSHDHDWPIGDHLKMDKAEDLFAWIADCIAEVVSEAIEAGTLASSENEILLGITFSFPMSQTCLSEATLLPMGKGFAITSNLNLGKMLLAGYARHCSDPKTNGTHTSSLNHQNGTQTPLPRIRVAAITNDTVATFASLAYAVKAAPNSRVAMGLIVGTGTNATVPMKLKNIHPAKRKDLPNPDVVETVVINTEWTIRGTDRPLNEMGIKTAWDVTLDANSDAPGFQPFEYMTAGRYLGEIVRLAYLDVASTSANDVPPLLLVKNALLTRFLSEVVARLEPEEVKKELEQRYPSTSTTAYWTSSRVNTMRSIAHAVQQRSSALIAAACVGLLNCVQDIEIGLDSSGSAVRNGFHASGSPPTEELVIAYAGGTISQYPHWLETCQNWIDELVRAGSAANASKKVVLKEAADGGIVGAGVLAGMTDDIA